MMTPENNSSTNTNNNNIIKPNTGRILQPMILQTKEELLTALKQGQIKTSKYNLLNDNEKLYIELVCFGGYTGEQAVKAIQPTVRNATAAANRMLANPDVVATMEELTVAKDMKFKAEVASARDMALAKLQYIMTTTSDDTLAASCAKTILDKAEASIKGSTNKDEPVGQVRFNIQVENMYTGPGGKTPLQDEPVIIELKPEEIDPAIKEARDLKDKYEQRAFDLGAKIPINPETGLKYTLNYEGVDNYHDKK
jgi:hypothetical protein